MNSLFFITDKQWSKVGTFKVPFCIDNTKLPFTAFVTNYTAVSNLRCLFCHLGNRDF